MSRKIVKLEKGHVLEMEYCPRDKGCSHYIMSILTKMPEDSYMGFTAIKDDIVLAYSIVRNMGEGCGEVMLSLSKYAFLRPLDNDSRWLYKQIRRGMNKACAAFGLKELNALCEHRHFEGERLLSHLGFKLSNIPDSYRFKIGGRTRYFWLWTKEV